MDAAPDGCTSMLFYSIASIHISLSCFSLKELDFQSRKREKVHGDRFVESIGAFVRAAQNSCTELDDAWDELKQKVQTKHELVSYQLLAIGT